jgi:YVTN family beta-propeller protein
MRRIPWIVLVLTLAAAALPAAGQILINTVPVQDGNNYLAANPATNMLYVVNSCGTDPTCSGQVNGTITVINGATNTVVTTITVQKFPQFLVINPETNKIYVTNRNSNTVTVINGANNTIIRNIAVGANPTNADINPITNTIYVLNNGNGSGTTMSIIDGSTDTVTRTLTVGNAPTWVAVNSVTNTIYVANYCGQQPGCTTHSAPSTVSVVNGANNTLVRTVTVDYGAQIIRVNPVTNKIWVLNSCGSNTQCPLTQGAYLQVNGTVTQIDGGTFNILRATVGKGSAAMTLNNVTNQAYTSATTDNTATVISGVALTTQTVNVGNSPEDIEVNTSTDTVIVCNSTSNTVTAINPVTLITRTVDVGTKPVQAWINPVVNRIYVSNVGNSTVSVLSGVSPTAIQFVPLTTPCRLVDTRSDIGGGPIEAETSENFDLPQLAQTNPQCNGIDISSALAYSLNVTAIPNTTLGYLTVWPTGEIQPYVSTMNSPDGRIKANAAIIPAGYQGAVSVFATDTTNLLIDINGYFTTPASGTLQYFTLPPCRIVDTRSGNGGPLQAGVERDYSIPGNCGVPSTALAYSFNVTVVPNNGPLDYLTVWPEGETQPVISTLNNNTGTVVANAAIVPAGSNNATAFFANDNSTNLLVDVDGYFATPGSGGLSLYPQVPCRVLDTRQGGGSGFNGPLVVNVMGSVCAPPSNAGGYVFNATVVPPGSMPYLTLWPDGAMQPTVSTLNAYDGFVTSNMAIVPTNNGSIDAFAAAQTQLILDLFGYFAP